MNARLLRLAAPCLLMVGLAVPAFGDEPVPAGFTRVRTEGGITEYVLDSNGLTVLLLPDSSAPAVTFMITYRVGSRNESYGTTGATHLLEHLMFKGTPRFNKENGNGFDQMLEKTGAITNATTWMDRTNYYETVPPEHLPLAVELEADRMKNLRLREDDRRPEMTVVRNEYEIGENDPAEALEKEVWATAIMAHPYHHSTIGWESDFEKVPIAKLREFYETFYWPDNATVSIIGDFSPAAALALVKQFFGDIPRSPHPIPQVYTEEPPQTGARRVLVQRPAELGVLMVAHKAPRATHPDHAPLKVLGTILTEGRNSRLYQALTDKSLTTDVVARPYFNRDDTLFLLIAELTPDTSHDDVEHKLLAEISRIQTGGVTANEVAAAIAKLTAETAFSRDGSFAMASELNECIAVGEWPLYDQLQAKIRAVSPEDVQRVAKRWFEEDQKTTGWFVPREESAEPSADDAPSAPTSAADSPAPIVSAIAEAGPANPSVSRGTDGPTPAAAAKIASRVQRSRTAGIDLLVCPTGVKDVVMLTGRLPAFEPKDPVLTKLAAGMLDRGTKSHDASALAARLDEVGATIRFEARSGGIEFSARCLSKDLPCVIGLLAEQLREPAFPADEFEKLRTQSIAEAEQQKEETTQQAAIAFSQLAHGPGHPLYRLTPDETIARLKDVAVDDVRKLHADWFGPEACVLVAVGDVAPQAAQAEVAKAFAGWSGGRPLSTPPKSAAAAAAIERDVEIPGKESVSVMLGLPTGLTFTDRDHLPLALATNVLGHGFTSRLVGTVRDTEGLTYGIAANLIGDGTFDRTWQIRASFAPELLEQGLSATRREIQNWFATGITAEELEYRKSSMAGDHQIRMATSEGLAEVLLEVVGRGLELSWIDDYPSQIRALTLDDVHAAVRRHLNVDHIATVKAGTLK